MLHSRRSLVLGAGAAIITRPARAAFAPLYRNPLVYPGGWARPGFDPKNFLLQGAGNGANNYPIRCSMVLTPSGAIRIDKAAGPPTISGAWTYPVDPVMGPTMLNATIGSSAIFQNFTLPTSVATTAGVTIGCIFRCNTNSGTNQELIGSTSSHLIGFRVNSLRLTMISVGTVTTDFIQLVQSRPYFVAMSVLTVSPFTINAVSVDLTNGALQTFSQAFAAITQDVSNTVMFFGGGGSTDSFSGNIAAGMYLRTYVDLNTLLKWAAAPWDFWYPPTQLSLMSATFANPAGSGAPQRALIGVGK